MRFRGHDDARLESNQFSQGSTLNKLNINMETVLNLEPIANLTREKFYQLCLANPDVLMERSPKGELITMSPIGGEGGRREANLIAKLWVWNEQTQLGFVFSSQTVFSLPNGGDRARRCGLGGKTTLGKLNSGSKRRVSAPLSRLRDRVEIPQRSLETPPRKNARILSFWTAVRVVNQSE